MSLPTRVNRSAGVEPFESMQRDLDNVLGRLLNGRGYTNGGGDLAPFGVDVREDADHIYVEADLPAHNEQTESKGDLLLNERRYHRFMRSFTLPPTVDEQAVNAKLQDGVLTVTLNKREESKPRKVTVS
jgi:HSP20 family molecular chaperone IbpA